MDCSVALVSSFVFSFVRKFLFNLVPISTLDEVSDTMNYEQRGGTCFSEEHGSSIIPTAANSQV
jgi:hypothetical protein